MKQMNFPFPARRRACGFTLIELLIVIVILAILISVGFNVHSNARERARQAQAATIATGIDTGLTRFRDDYYRFPDVAGAAAGQDADRLPSAGEIVVVLTGRESGGNIENRRKINYIDNMQETYDYNNGIQFGPGNPPVPEGIYDPWSDQSDPRPFLISWDGTGDGTIPDPEGIRDRLNRSVAVISQGRSGQSGTDETNRDNVRSY